MSDSDQGYDDDGEYKDDYDAWDDETAWGKGANTAPTTATGEEKLIATTPKLITTSPIFCFGSLAPPKAIHVGDPSPDDHADPTADECADSTADDCSVSAENCADFTANGRADAIANDRTDSTADGRADSNTGGGGFSSTTHDMAEVGSVAKTLLGNDLNDALREQTLALGQLRRAVAAKLSTTESRLKGDKAIAALLKEKFTAMHLPEMERPAVATAVASQVENTATSAAPVRSSPETDDAPSMPRGASATLSATSALHAGPDVQRRPPGPSGRRRTDTPVRRRPLGTRLLERPSPLDRNAPPPPVPPPRSHPAPPPPPEPPPTQHQVNFEQERNAMVLLCLFYEIRFARQRLPRLGKKPGDGVRPSVAPRRRLESIPLSHRRGIDVEGTGGGGPAADAAAAASKAAELSSSGNRLPKTIVRRLWS